ncbi:MAG TPA: protein kinase [Candidatus Acidoferrum sp.]
MPLAPGNKLGPYEIVAPLGAGGMGEVYRARDTRLERTVAIKILPEHLSRDPVRKQRFELEAKTISSLNHPNICTLHDIGSQDGVDYLVMECVEGQTLGKRLEKGSLPLEQVLKYGVQIADALDKAHRAGIVHRDLKPVNIMLTATGAKLLDFGLAKPAAPLVSGATLSVARPTTPVTEEGIVVGTFQYMSPEQVEGKELDGRSDIFSLGAVLYEMVTGKKAFEGKSHLSVASAILEKEPAPLSVVKPMTPPTLDHAIRRCLAKDREERWQTARDLEMELKWVTEPSSLSGSFTTKKRSNLAAVYAITGVLLGAALVAGIASMFRAKPAYAPVVRFSVAAPKGQAIAVESPPQFALSPDGTRLAFYAANSAGRYELYLRSMDSDGAKLLPGTGNTMNPFFSPDSEWVGLYSYDLSKLEKLTLSGGAPQPLCEVAGGTTANWPEMGSIIMAMRGQGLFRVPSTGGTLQPIVAPGVMDEFLRNAPEVLPGERGILFVGSAGLASQNDIVALDLISNKWKTVIQQGVNPHYLEPGYIVFGRSSSIWVAPFDAEHLKLTGQPAPVVNGVLVERPGIGVEQFAVSKNGTLAYLAGTGAEAQRQIVLVDAKGVAKTLTEGGKPFEDLSLSPDGTKLALTVEGSTWNIWIYNIIRKTLARLTFENDNRDPLWTPDGKRVVYTSLRNGVYGLYWRPADGSGPEEQLLSGKNIIYASSWSPDGHNLAYWQFDLQTKEDIWILPLQGDRKPYPFVQTPFTERFAAFSPDGHWMAYESNETGRPEIYIQPFPNPGGKWQISTEGGSRPEWSNDGKQIFYLTRNELMAVQIETKPAFSAGRPELLFGANYFTSGHYYDVMPDGKHFVFIQSAQQSDRPSQINVVINWSEELEQHMRANQAR